MGRVSESRTELLAAIDQGTTSTRCVIITRSGEVVASAQCEHRQIMPRQGWVEHDAAEIWANVRQVVSQAVVDIDATPEDISALGLTNQRETAVVWEKATGRPIHNAIVWQDTRTSAIGGGDPERWLERTGLLASSYPAGPKIAWFLDHVDGARERAERGELLAGTMDTWLLWNLTGGARGDEGRPAVHATDVTNASRTLLMDLRTQTWDEELCEKVGVPLAVLPEIRASIGDFGTVRHRGTLAGVPIAAILGDQSAALFGQACFEPGDAKNTYGTGLFLLLNTGDQPHFSEHGLLTTIGWQVAGEEPVYALEGSVAVGGSLIQWLRDQLGILRTAGESETLAREVPDSAGVYVVPAFSGLFAPRWRPDARGVIVGLTRFADRRHIARAALEATCLQTREVVDAMVADSGVQLGRLRVDGGMVANDLLMQLQADVLGIEVERPANIETTVLGAAFAAGYGRGLYYSLSDIAGLVPIESSWSPAMSQVDRGVLVDGWNRAVEKSFDLAGDE
ncbi:glycerol kinase GlpK [Corynebacterium doosanense]|uniref:glycerol kinase n=1 Tax=Corynebacterium doosanense CAU 212 = DSM 45436 TaxID=558173 RepID=A0A097IIQ8_9CORY|nr:glycerol kinase GlpK [Corynebacterium doosanense]AIT62015.1 glycerol kinase [Corynebacterium doosanense CAU 212 = DSM 45436]